MKKSTSHGGRRSGAGRHNLSGEANHMKRPRIDGRKPLLITVELRKDVPRIRGRKRARPLYESLNKTKKGKCRFLRFASNKRKIFILVEAKKNEDLAKALQSFSIRLAKNIKKEMRHLGLTREGPILLGRYRMTCLHTKKELQRSITKYFIKKTSHFFSFINLSTQLIDTPTLQNTLQGTIYPLRP